MQTESQIELNNVYKGRAMTVPELSQMEAVLLADASTTAPTSRLTEMVLVAKYIDAGITIPIITNIYPAMDIASAIEGTPLSIVLESQNTNEFSLVGNPLYSAVFGDPLVRANAIREKRLAKDGEVAADAVTLKYLSRLPANLFANCEGENFVDFITRQRAMVIMSILGASELPGNFTFENTINTYKNYTLAEILTQLPFDRVPVGKFCCPECSFNPAQADQEPVYHVLGSDGLLYKNRGSFMNKGGGEVKCRQFKNAAFDPTSLTLSQLIDLGFKLDGKFTFMLEAFASSNPALSFLIRDYSTPRGTVEDFAKFNISTELLTPRIYITVEDNGGKRDANAFDFNDESKDLVLQFMQAIPLLADGMRYELNLFRKEVTIDAAET